MLALDNSKCILACARNSLRSLSSSHPYHLELNVICKRANTCLKPSTKMMYKHACFRSAVTHVCAGGVGATKQQAQQQKRASHKFQKKVTRGKGDRGQVCGQVNNIVVCDPVGGPLCPLRSSRLIELNEYVFSEITFLHLITHVH